MRQQYVIKAEMFPVNALYSNYKWQLHVSAKK